MLHPLSRAGGAGGAVRGAAETQEPGDLVVLLAAALEQVVLITHGLIEQPTPEEQRFGQKVGVEVALHQ